MYFPLELDLDLENTENNFFTNSTVKKFKIHEKRCGFSCPKQQMKLSISSQDKMTCDALFEYHKPTNLYKTNKTATRRFTTRIAYA